MKEDNKKNTISMSAAVTGDCIDAENAVVSKLQSGEENSFDAESEEKKAAEFEELIKGKFKKQFSKKVQKIVKSRIKEVKELKETSDKNAEFVSALMEKFNIKDGDTEKLERMIDEMMTHENNNDKTKNTQLLRRLIAENSFLKEERDSKIRAIEARSRAEKWRKEAEETKKAYPDFDINKELENPEFCRLLKAGVGVKSAYEVLNIEAILDKNSKEAEKMVVNSIRLKGNRPVENGSDPTSGIILASNVDKLTKKQRAELAKRAARGEKIEF